MNDRTFFFVLQTFHIVIEDGWLQIMSDIYKAEFIKFMHFRDNIPYSWGHEFSTEQLLTITPQDLCAYMNLRSYKETHPSASAWPIYARLSTLLSSKKQCLESCLGMRWFGIPFKKKVIQLCQAK